MTDFSEISEICPTCQAAVDTSELEPLSRVACPACGAQLLVCQHIAHYQLLEVVGRGGMGVVYKALDTSLNRNVALKVLRKDHSQNADFIAQLETEAAITASINHPHVVRVFTTGTDQGRFYLAMELVDKGTLDDLINLQGQVAEAQVLEIGTQIAQGLRAAYQHGLIHRDVKPGNILFADSHTAKIVDFGLAMLEAASEGGGEIWGTPYYVAPEKLDQKPEDARSDMYSLGATLFHALAGRPPFEAADATMVALKHLKSQAVSLQAFAPHISGSTAYVINRTLLKDPDQRYQTYDELIEHLEYARAELEQKGTQPAAKNRVVLETEEEQKLWSYVTFGMLGVAALLGLGGWWYFSTHQKSTPSEAPATALALGAGDARLTKEYEDARQLLLSGKPAEAAKAFHALATEKKVPALLVNWSLVHEGLSALLANKTADAKAAFSTLQTRDLLGSTAQEQELSGFFRDLGKIGADDQPTPVAALNDYSRENYGAIVPLIAGLKNWQLGHFDEGGTVLRQFQSAAPKGQYAWISEYRDLPADYIADFSDYRSAVELVKMVKTPQQQQHALESLTKTRKTLRTQGKLAERFDEIAQDLKNQGDTRKRQQAQADAAEAAGLKSVRDQVTPLCKAWKFDDAKQKVLSSSLKGASANRERHALLRKLDWLSDWKSMLAGDLSGGTAKSPLKRKDGTDIKESIAKAGKDGVELKGGTSVAWQDLAPASLISFATEATRPEMPVEVAARRQWLTGVFAAMSGDATEAERLLTTAARSRPDFEAALPLLLPQARPDAENLALGKKATASSVLIDPRWDQSARNAVDGNIKTKWCTKEATPQWLQVDLAKEVTVSQWIVRHAQSNSETADSNTADFELQSSGDGQKWTTVDRVVGNTAAVTQRLVTPFRAQYVRLFVTKASRRTNDPAIRICDVELHGPSRNAMGDLAKAFFEPVGWFGTAPLDSTDLGHQQGKGTTDVNDATGEITIGSMGGDVWLAEDSFRFVYQKLRGNGQIVAHVLDAKGTGDNWAKAGIMFRAALGANVKNAFFAVTPGPDPGPRISMQRRANAGGESESKPELHKGATPVWIKLVRHDNRFTASTSQDGVNWQEYHSLDVAMDREAYVGLGVSSHKEGDFFTATFDQVQITPEEPSPARTGGSASASSGEGQAAVALSSR